MFGVEVVARLWKNNGDKDLMSCHGPHVPEVEMRITQSNTSAGVSLPCAFFGILSALLVLMGLLLVVRLRTNDNELAASPGHGHL